MILTPAFSSLQAGEANSIAALGIWGISVCLRPLSMTIYYSQINSHLQSCSKVSRLAFSPNYIVTESPNLIARRLT